MSLDDGVASPRAHALDRGLSLSRATALNMIDMIGVGPFITMPLIIHAMGGPQAMLGWIAGAVLAICDSLVWAELGAAMPASGGSYQYLKHIYGPQGLGRMLSFLFVWQLSFTAPLSIASGAIGFARYASYLWPSLEVPLVAHTASAHLPWLGALELRLLVNGATFVAIAVVLLATWLLSRRISVVGRLSILFWLGVIVTIAWVIFAGLMHFNVRQAFDFPPGAFTFGWSFFGGLGTALLIATYDYWGYYNVCFLGAEVVNPERNIPYALLLSITFVALIYLVMNISLLGVIPWRQLATAAQFDTRFYVLSSMMERLYGAIAGIIVTLLIMWTAFASVFSLLLGYSRVPYAAALDGNYFRAFGRLHPRHRMPHVSLWGLGATAAALCCLRLADVISALVVIRVAMQFLLQILGVIWFRVRQPYARRPFRMWFYPAPAVLAFAGFIYVLFARPNFLREVRYALVLAISGCIIFLLLARRTGDWPFMATKALSR